MNRKLFIGLMAASMMVLAACGAQPAAPAQTATNTQASAPAAQPADMKALPQEINVSEAKAMQDAGAFMLDVREPAEWNELHMPGATLIPLGQLASRLSEVPKDKPVVVVCRSGNRSQQGRDILAANGFTSVTSMAGGMRDWQGAGLPTVTGP
jgi:rhodanese-related sulfurtransferase